MENEVKVIRSRNSNPCVVTQGFVLTRTKRYDRVKLPRTIIGTVLEDLAGSRPVPVHEPVGCSCNCSFHLLTFPHHNPRALLPLHFLLYTEFTRLENFEESKIRQSSSPL